MQAIRYPLKVNGKVSVNDRSVLHDRWAFQRLVGKLVYLTIIRQDLPHAMCVISQNVHSPKTGHVWK